MFSSLSYWRICYLGYILIFFSYASWILDLHHLFRRITGWQNEGLRSAKSHAMINPRGKHQIQKVEIISTILSLATFYFCFHIAKTVRTSSAIGNKFELLHTPLIISPPQKHPTYLQLMTSEEVFANVLQIGVQITDVHQKNVSNY